MYTDLNPLIENAMEKDDLELMKNILSCSIQPKKLLEIVNKTRKYNYLPLLLPFIHSRSEHKDLLANICCNALEQGISLEKEFSDEFYDEDMINDISCLAGQRGIPFHLLKDVYGYGNIRLYELGVIIGDKDDLFSTNHNGSLLGLYCSKKCMIKLGFSNKYLEIYLQDALLKQNIETIEFLKEQKCDLNPPFKELVLNNYISCEEILFCFKQGLSLDQDAYDTLKASKHKLYSKLVEQV